MIEYNVVWYFSLYGDRKILHEMILYLLCTMVHKKDIVIVITDTKHLLTVTK